MTKHRFGWGIAAICLLLAAALAFGSLLLIRGDVRYRLCLMLRRYDEPAWRVVSPVDLTERALSDLLADARVREDRSLLLVNSEHPIPTETEPSLIEVGAHRADPLAADAFEALAAYVREKTGEELLIRSAYRDREEQAGEWEAGGSDLAASPGHSEHELGLALDVCVAGYGGASFLKTEAGRLVNDVCGEYGFVIRYPLGKENATGFAYEPWHLRYVGLPHSEIIMDAGLTVEEYLELLLPNVWYQSGDCLILRTAAESVPTPNQFTACTVSPDNLGYRVFTFYGAP